MADPLSRSFYQRPTVDVARTLLGKILVRQTGEGRVAVRLIEVEAYLGPSDPACHTFGGRRTARVESMWSVAGHAYVYLIYGVHHCLNVVTVGEGVGEAVLLRGAVVVEGGELVRRRRGPRPSDQELLNGPGKLCQALAVDRKLDGWDLCSNDGALWIIDDGCHIPVEEILVSPRIGLGEVGEAARWPLRYRIRQR